MPPTLSTLLPRTVVPSITGVHIADTHSFATDYTTATPPASDKLPPFSSWTPSLTQENTVFLSGTGRDSGFSAFAQEPPLSEDQPASSESTSCFVRAIRRTAARRGESFLGNGPALVPARPPRDLASRGPAPQETSDAHAASEAHRSVWCHAASGAHENVAHSRSVRRPRSVCRNSTAPPPESCAKSAQMALAPGGSPFTPRRSNLRQPLRRDFGSVSVLDADTSSALTDAHQLLQRQSSHHPRHRRQKLTTHPASPR